MIYKRDIALQIFNDLVDEVFQEDFNELIENKDKLIEIIERRLSSYLIVEGGNILIDVKGNIRI